MLMRRHSGAMRSMNAGRAIEGYVRMHSGLTLARAPE